MTYDKMGSHFFSAIYPEPGDTSHTFVPSCLVEEGRAPCANPQMAGFTGSLILSLQQGKFLKVATQLLKSFTYTYSTTQSEPVYSWQKQNMSTLAPFLVFCLFGD